MANWDDIINNKITMGRARHLCYALNVARRRRAEGIDEWRPGVNPFIGRGIRPILPRFNHWERVPENNNYRYAAQGRSRSFPAPPQQDIRRQPHSQLHCLTAGFGYVAPNALFPSRLNSLPPMSLTHLTIYHPLLPLSKIGLTQKRPKVPPQDLILRLVTHLRPIVAALKTLFPQFLFFYFITLVYFITYADSDKFLQL